MRVQFTLALRCRLVYMQMSNTGTLATPYLLSLTQERKGGYYRSQPHGAVSLLELQRFGPAGKRSPHQEKRFHYRAMNQGLRSSYPRALSTEPLKGV